MHLAIDGLEGVGECFLVANSQLTVSIGVGDLEGRIDRWTMRSRISDDRDAHGVLASDEFHGRIQTIGELGIDVVIEQRNTQRRWAVIQLVECIVQLLIHNQSGIINDGLLSFLIGVVVDRRGGEHTSGASDELTRLQGERNTNITASSPRLV